MSQWTSQEARPPGSQGCLMYSAMDFGEQTTLLESLGSGVTDVEAQPALLSQLLQDPTNHYLEVTNFFTSAENEICIRVTAVWCNVMLSFTESLRSWIKGLSLFRSALQLLKEPARCSP